MMDDREFWKAVRAALLLMVDAIERRYSLGKHAPAKVIIVTQRDNIAG